LITARIGVVARRVLRQFWLWMTGRYHRFGYAGVSFGTPVSLTKFLEDTAGDVIKPLARHLMAQIGSIVPVLPVPMVAWVLLEQSPLSRTAIESRIDALVERMPHAHIHMPRHDRSYAVEVGLRQLVERGTLAISGGEYSVNADRRELLDFYANSIRHLILPLKPEESAPAGVNSAPARS
jgi:glycerol-3-phosphate O-acyltransferase